MPCRCNKDGKKDPDLKDGTNCGINFKKDSYVQYDLKGKFCTAISDKMTTNIKLGFRYSRSKRLGKYELDNNLSLQKKVIWASWIRTRRASKVRCMRTQFYLRCNMWEIMSDHFPCFVRKDGRTDKPGYRDARTHQKMKHLSVLNSNCKANVNLFALGIWDGIRRRIDGQTEKLASYFHWNMYIKGFVDDI